MKKIAVIAVTYRQFYAWRDAHPDKAARSIFVCEEAQLQGHEIESVVALGTHQWREDHFRAMREAHRRIRS